MNAYRLEERKNAGDEQKKQGSSSMSEYQCSEEITYLFFSYVLLPFILSFAKFFS